MPSQSSSDARRGWGRGDWSFDDVTCEFPSDWLVEFADEPSRQLKPRKGSMLDMSRLRSLLEERPGVFILRGLAAIRSDRWLSAFTRVCESFGRLVPQDIAGETLIREVRYRKGSMSNRAMRYSDTRSGGSFHTDGVHMDSEVPDYIGLLCVRDAEVGGELVFIDSQSVQQRLSDLDPSVMATLSHEFTFDQRHPHAPWLNVRRRILHVDQSGRTMINYLRDYIESARARGLYNGADSAELAALDQLDEILNDEQLHVEGRLVPGDIVLSNNMRLLHGRHEFRDSPQMVGRLMQRAWIRAHA